MKHEMFWIMMETGEILSEWFFPYFNDMVEKWRGVNE